jgi:hypothetical protein
MFVKSANLVIDVRLRRVRVGWLLPAGVMKEF